MFSFELYSSFRSKILVARQVETILEVKVVFWKLS